MALNISNKRVSKNIFSCTIYCFSQLSDPLSQSKLRDVLTGYVTMLIHFCHGWQNVVIWDGGLCVVLQTLEKRKTLFVRSSNLVKLEIRNVVVLHMSSTAKLVPGRVRGGRINVLPQPLPVQQGQGVQDLLVDGDSPSSPRYQKRPHIDLSHLTLRIVG